MSEKELRLAIEQKNQAELQRIIKKNPAILDCPLTEDGYTAIHLVAAHGDASSMSWLLDYQPQLKDKTTSIGYTPLMLAAHHYDCPLEQDARMHLNEQAALLSQLNSLFVRVKPGPNHCAIIRLLIQNKANQTLTINASGHPLHGYSFLDFARAPQIRIFLVELLSTNEYNGKQWLVQTIDALKSDSYHPHRQFLNKLNQTLLSKDPNLTDSLLEKAFEDENLPTDGEYLPINFNMDEAFRLQIFSSYKTKFPQKIPKFLYKLAVRESSYSGNSDLIHHPNLRDLSWLLNRDIEICFSGNDNLLPGMVYSIIKSDCWNSHPKEQELFVRYCIKNYPKEISQPILGSRDTLIARLTRENNIKYIMLLKELPIESVIYTSNDPIFCANSLNVFKLFDYSAYLDTAKDYTDVLHPIFTTDVIEILEFMLQSLPTLVHIRNKGETPLLKFISNACTSIHSLTHIDKIKLLLKHNANPFDVINNPQHIYHGLNAIQILNCHILTLNQYSFPQIKGMIDELHTLITLCKCTTNLTNRLDPNNLAAAPNSENTLNPHRLLMPKKQPENDGVQPSQTGDYLNAWNW
ncbi:MAG: hypothetical protein Q8R83_00050 [Legionellaceae bacterium]|nr:hypothetical protein [Legionellaceae bacterium]